MDKDLRRAIKIGISQAIDAHGPIKKSLIGSAIKRIEGQLKKKDDKIEKKLAQNRVGMS